MLHGEKFLIWYSHIHFTKETDVVVTLLQVKLRTTQEYCDEIL